MAWTEQTGKHAWRVRYPTTDGHIASISGFTSQKAADDHAADIETDQRRRLWIDPALGKTTVEDWATPVAPQPRHRHPHLRQIRQQPAQPHPAPLGHRPTGKTVHPGHH